MIVDPNQPAMLSAADVLRVAAAARFAEQFDRARGNTAGPVPGGTHNGGPALHPLLVTGESVGGFYPARMQMLLDADPTWSDLADGREGPLTTRTDNDTGAVTLSAGHGFITGDKIDIAWSGGSRKDMDATVAGNVVSLDGGTGDNLPIESTTLTLSKDDCWILATGSQTFEEGQRTFGLVVGEKEEDSLPVFVAAASEAGAPGAPGAGGVWHARIINNVGTTSGGAVKYGWKEVRLNSSGVWVDAGGSGSALPGSTTFAVCAKNWDGSSFAEPLPADSRVLMWASVGWSGRYEFLPVQDAQRTGTGPYTYYPGILNTTTQWWKGEKNLAGSLAIDGPSASAPPPIATAYFVSYPDGVAFQAIATATGGAQKANLYVNQNGVFAQVAGFSIAGGRQFDSLTPFAAPSVYSYAHVFFEDGAQNYGAGNRCGDNGWIARANNNGSWNSGTSVFTQAASGGGTATTHFLGFFWGASLPGPQTAPVSAPGAGTQPNLVLVYDSLGGGTHFIAVRGRLYSDVGFGCAGSDGLTTTQTFKDASGNNKTMTITGGIITAIA